MNDLIKKYEKPIFIIISMLVSASIFIDLNISKSYENIFYDNTGIIALIMIYFNYLFMQRIKNLGDKRLRICSAIFSLLFSVFTIIGISFNMYEGFDAICSNYICALKSLVKFAGLFVLYYELLIEIFSRFLDLKVKDKTKTVVDTSKKSFLVRLLIIYICYLPYFFYYYPGLYHNDSFSSIAQSFGIIGLNSHHPIFFTGIVSLFMRIGEFLGNVNEGIALYSVAQMILMAFAFSYVIHYMAKYKVDYRIRIFALLYFALLPMNATFSISLLKDTPFLIFMTIKLIEIIKMVIEKEKYFECKRNIIVFAISTLLTMLFRNNGLYVVILSLPFLAIYNRKNILKLAIAYLAIFAVFAIYSGPITNALGVKKGSAGEAFSIPCQQFARIAKFHGDELTDEEKEMINNYLNYDSLASVYNGQISDPVKGSFKDEYYQKDKLSLFKLYFHFLAKYPKDTFEAFIDNSFGYYYPDVVYWKMLREPLDPTGKIVDGIGIKWTPIINLKILYYIIIALNYANLSFITVLISPGLQFWILLMCVCYCIYKKEYWHLIMYVPLFALWLTCIASPVNSMFRYIYPLYIIIPFFVGLLKRQNA